MEIKEVQPENDSVKSNTSDKSSKEKLTDVKLEQFLKVWNILETRVDSFKLKKGEKSIFCKEWQFRKVFSMVKLHSVFTLDIINSSRLIQSAKAPLKSDNLEKVL
jgi:hypothetical protein